MNENFNNVMRIINRHKGNTLTKEEKGIIDSEYIEVKNNNLHIPDIENFLRSIKMFDESNQRTLKRILNNRQIGIRFNDNQKNEYITALLIRKGLSKNTSRLISIAKGIINEDLSLNILRRKFPDRDIQPIENNKEIIDDIIRRYNMKESDRGLIERKLKHFGQIDFTDRFNNLIEVKSTKNKTFRETDIFKRTEGEYPFDNLNKAVSTRFINPDARELEIYVIDERNELFRYDLNLSSLRPRQNRYVNEVLNTYNPITNSSSISGDSRLTFIYQDAILRRHRNIIFRGGGSFSTGISINIPIEDFTFIGFEGDEDEEKVNE